MKTGHVGPHHPLRMPFSSERLLGPKAFKTPGLKPLRIVHRPAAVDREGQLCDTGSANAPDIGVVALGGDTTTNIAARVDPSEQIAR
jgi:hypothetical protein